MQNTHLKRIVCSAFMLAGLGLTSLKAQSFFGDVIKGGVADGQLLMNSYMKPYIKAFGADMNSGWYNTAKTHALGRPDLTFTVNNAFIPTSDKAFDIANIGLQNLGYYPGKTITPTAAGSSDPGAPANVYIKHPTGLKGPDIQLPPGTGLAVLPLPNVQLGVGLLYNTDLIVRYIPTLKFGDVSVGLFGIGLKHDIKQWIPGISELPFDWSVLFGYSSFKTNYTLDLPNPTTNKPYNDQNLSLKFTNMTFGTMVSKKFSVLTGYFGVGYDYTKATLAMTGTYGINGFDDNINSPTFGGQKAYEVKDPVNLTFSDVSNGVKATLGMRLKFAFFTMHADYTLAKYSVLSAGLGISVGN